MSAIALTCLTLYLFFGLVVCAAERAHDARSWPQTCLTFLLWPFVAPFVLGRAFAPQPVASAEDGSQVQEAARKFQRAVEALDEVTQAILADYVLQVEDAVKYGESMERRVSHLTRMTQSPEFDMQRVTALKDDLGGRVDASNDRVMRSVLNRRRNIESLHHMVDDAQKEVQRVVFSLEDITTQVALFGVGGPSLQSHLLEDLTDQLQHICTHPVTHPIQG